MSSYDIINRENEPLMLKIQFAARYCYNSAEIQNYFVWLFCLVSAFSIFLPDELPWYVSFAVPFIADIIAWILMILVNRNVQKAADLRKYFDAYSIGISEGQFSETEKRRLTEIAEDRYLRNPQKAELQMRNTGSDLPPGVHNWYEFSKEYTGLEAKFECQRQNTWWDAKLFPTKYAVTVIVLVIVAVAYIVLMRQNGFWRTILSSAGLLVKLIERIYDNRRYRDLSIKIEGALQTVEASLTVGSIERLQIFIDERRAVNILGINFLHKKWAGKLTKEYENISNPR